MADIKLVQKVATRNSKLIGVKTKGRPKKRWKDEVICNLKMVKLRDWSQHVKDRKACNYLVQKNIGL
jgi:hypothetical protein